MSRPPRAIVAATAKLRFVEHHGRRKTSNLEVVLVRRNLKVDALIVAITPARPGD